MLRRPRRGPVVSLASALGRDPMILYRHAQGKAALLNDVAETVLTGLRSMQPTPTGPANRAQSPATTWRSLSPTLTWCRCLSRGPWPRR